MLFLYLILAWFAVFFGLLLYLRINDNMKNGRAFYDFGKSNFLIACVFLFAGTWGIVNAIGYEPQFSSPAEQIAYGAETNQPWVSNEALWKETEAHPDSIDLHFQLVRNHFAQLKASTGAPDMEAYFAEEEKMFALYEDFSRSNNTKLHDIGHIMLADLFLSQEVPDYDAASIHLRAVDDPSTKYVNYHAAHILMGSPMAEEHLYSEIRNKGYKKGAYEYLGMLYTLQQRDSSLRSIVYSGAADYIAPEIRTRVYFEDRDFARFFSLKLETLLGGISVWGLSGGFAILLVWMYVLVSFGKISSIRLPHLLFPVLGGAAVPMLAWWLYAQYRYGFGFALDGSVFNDFIFSVTGIGVIEEFVKLIPFLCVLFFTRVMQKPIDYIIVASACGLGFAVFENLMYISEYGLDAIHSRALTSSVSHMACSGITAYGFVLCKYRWKNQYWLIPVFFLLAAIAHGFYDFWLLNESVKAYIIITLFFYLSLIVMYYSFISNAINQSVQETESAVMARFDPLRITSVFAGSMILLFTFEYIATSAVYGTHYGNTSMQKAFLAGGYLVFFLSIRLSRLRIEPQRWNKIDFLSGILPSRLLGDKTDAEEQEEEPTSSPDEQTLPPGSR